MKPRMPQGRNLLGAPVRYWPVAQSAEHSAVNGEDARSRRAWPATFTMRTHSSAGRAPLLQGGGTWFDSKCVYHSCDVSSVGTERRFAMPEVEGSTPSRRATHREHSCGVSSADQSSWFRPRRSQVRVLHAAPIDPASSHRGLVALPRKQMAGQPARRFESSTRRQLFHGGVSSTARAPGCEPGGCGFEPRTSPQARAAPRSLTLAEQLHP